MSFARDEIETTAGPPHKKGTGGAPEHSDSDGSDDDKEKEEKRKKKIRQLAMKKLPKFLRDDSDQSDGSLEDTFNDAVLRHGYSLQQEREERELEAQFERMRPMNHDPLSPLGDMLQLEDTGAQEESEEENEDQDDKGAAEQHGVPLNAAGFPRFSMKQPGWAEGVIRRDLERKENRRKGIKNPESDPEEEEEEAEQQQQQQVVSASSTGVNTFASYNPEDEEEAEEEEEDEEEAEEEEDEEEREQEEEEGIDRVVDMMMEFDRFTEIYYQGRSQLQIGNTKISSGSLRSWLHKECRRATGVYQNDLIFDVAQFHLVAGLGNGVTDYLAGTVSIEDIGIANPGAITVLRTLAQLATGAITEIRALIKAGARDQDEIRGAARVLAQAVFRAAAVVSRARKVRLITEMLEIDWINIENDIDGVSDNPTFDIDEFSRKSIGEYKRDLVGIIQQKRREYNARDVNEDTVVNWMREPIRRLNLFLLKEMCIASPDGKKAPLEARWSAAIHTPNTKDEDDTGIFPSGAVTQSLAYLYNKNSVNKMLALHAALWVSCMHMEDARGEIPVLDEHMFRTIDQLGEMKMPDYAKDKHTAEGRSMLAKQNADHLYDYSYKVGFARYEGLRYWPRADQEMMDECLRLRNALEDRKDRNESKNSRILPRVRRAALDAAARAKKNKNGSISNFFSSSSSSSSSSPSSSSSSSKPVPPKSSSSSSSSSSNTRPVVGASSSSASSVDQVDGNEFRRRRPEDDDDSPRLENEVPPPALRHSSSSSSSSSASSSASAPVSSSSYVSPERTFRFPKSRLAIDLTNDSDEEEEESADKTDSKSKKKEKDKIKVKPFFNQHTPLAHQLRGAHKKGTYIGTGLKGCEVPEGKIYKGPYYLDVDKDVIRVNKVVDRERRIAAIELMMLSPDVPERSKILKPTVLPAAELKEIGDATFLVYDNVGRTRFKKDDRVFEFVENAIMDKAPVMTESVVKMASDREVRQRMTGTMRAAVIRHLYMRFIVGAGDSGLNNMIVSNEGHMFKYHFDWASRAGAHRFNAHVWQLTNVTCHVGVDAEEEPMFVPPQNINNISYNAVVVQDKGSVFGIDLEEDRTINVINETTRKTVKVDLDNPDEYAQSMTIKQLLSNKTNLDGFEEEIGSLRRIPNQSEFLKYLTPAEFSRWRFAEFVFRKELGDDDTERDWWNDGRILPPGLRSTEVLFSVGIEERIDLGRRRKEDLQPFPPDHEKTDEEDGADDEEQQADAGEEEDGWQNADFEDFEEDEFEEDV